MAYKMIMGYGMRKIKDFTPCYCSFNALIELLAWEVLQRAQHISAYVFVSNNFYFIESQLIHY